jgi:glycine cleavage system H protein
MNQYPQELRYTEEHEWILVQGREATVGITEYAVKQLGDITLVELPEKGRELEKKEVFGVVESVKTVADIFAPISGTVICSNLELLEHPEYINEDPYKKGWMIKMRILKLEEIETLMDAAKYQAYIKEEEAK